MCMGGTEGIWLKCTFWFCSSGEGGCLKFCISHPLPPNAETAGLGITLSVAVKEHKLQQCTRSFLIKQLVKVDYDLPFAQSSDFLSILILLMSQNLKGIQITSLFTIVFTMDNGWGCDFLVILLNLHFLGLSCWKYRSGFLAISCVSENSLWQKWKRRQVSWLPRQPASHLDSSHLLC